MLSMGMSYTHGSAARESVKFVSLFRAKDMQLDMRMDYQPAPRARSRRSGLVWLLGLLLATTSSAGIFQCIDAKGMKTFSDKPCAPSSPDPESQSAGPNPKASPMPELQALSAKQIKARQVLLQLRIAIEALTPDSGQAIIEEISPELVRDLDPNNKFWNPQNGRWHSMLEFIKGDLRKDIGAAIRAGNDDILKRVSIEYASHAQEADLDALLKYINSAEGGRYVAFQNVVHSINAQSLRELMEQQPVTPEEPSALVLKQRASLLSLSLDARIAADGGGPASNKPSLGSAAVLENTARRQGTALDVLWHEYEPDVANFGAFNKGEAARHFFVAVEPAYRTAAALTGVTPEVFADQEAFKYGERWQANYGPPIRIVQSSTTVVVRNRYTSTVVTSRTAVPVGGMSPEYMALQCEQREGTAYRARNNRYTDSNAQAAALKSIQDRCRIEQRLAPY
jgi:Domain of unknown function (DUF4124)